MPELPEVQAIADYVDGRAAGLPIRRVDVASLAVLKTAEWVVCLNTGALPERDTIFGSNQRALSRNAA